MILFVHQCKCCHQNKNSRDVQGDTFHTAYGAQIASSSIHQWKVQTLKTQYSCIKMGVSSNVKHLESSEFWNKTDAQRYTCYGYDGDKCQAVKTEKCSTKYSSSDTIAIELNPNASTSRFTTDNAAKKLAYKVQKGQTHRLAIGTPDKRFNNVGSTLLRSNVIHLLSLSA